MYGSNSLQMPHFKVHAESFLKFQYSYHSTLLLSIIVSFPMSK
jgi:hypothetical protein